ncbi:hypothetical protein RRG08_039728 [Elysia crispata]|uniref:Uncharacterized protein n=1 Tax=Elysia crispata TaxID=231223 RepID=A0AAE0YBP2_9GAST|nr:hypothetical protein RRG08_039728 [Elysia crispata]
MSKRKLFSSTPSLGLVVQGSTYRRLLEFCFSLGCIQHGELLTLARRGNNRSGNQGEAFTALRAGTVRLWLSGSPKPGSCPSLWH